MRLHLDDSCMACGAAWGEFFVLLRPGVIGGELHVSDQCFTNYNLVRQGLKLGELEPWKCLEPLNLPGFPNW